MIEWSEQHLVIRDMVRKFIEAEIKPRLEELEHGDTPPYDVLRKMMKAFGIDEMQKMRFERQIARERAAARGDASAPKRDELVRRGGKMQVPYLVDPNTGREMYESDTITAYLDAEYGAPK